MALAPGMQIGPNRIVSLLGSGGMGGVWRARDATLTRDVAIKVLPPAFAIESERVALESLPQFGAGEEAPARFEAHGAAYRTLPRVSPCAMINRRGLGHGSAGSAWRTPR